MSEEAKKKEESAVGYIPPLLQGVYRGLEEWKILDESRTGYAVADLSTGQRKFLWANKAALSWMFKRPLEKMADIDLNNAQSQAVRDNLAMIYNKVQCNGDTNIDVKTVYFEGKPNTLKIFSSPVRCVPPGSEEEKTVVLFEYTSMNDGNFDEFQKFWRLSSELLRHVELMVMSFDASTETQEVFYQNNKAKAFYKDAFKEGEAGLKRWCDTCVFDSESEDAMTCSELHARIVSQKVEDKPIEFDCCKKTAPEHVHEHIAEEDTPTWHHVIIKVVYDPNTAKPSIFVQEHPVTMLKQVQKHLLQAHAAQEAFFVSISHELRSPLNGVIGLCSSLVQDKNLDKNQLKTLRLIQSSGQRMLAIVNDILDAGSVKHGELVVKQENVSLAQVCTDVCEVLRPLVQRGASLRSKVSGVTCPRVRGDEGRIMQILTNLVSNAIKFTHRGSVTIEAKEDKHGMVLVEIHDDGVGIAADKLSEIWGAFKQADRATTQKYGGTGLGLPLVKKLVQAHGGRVGCRSVIGTGSTFWFTLPIVAPSSPLATGRRLSTVSIECEASMLERQDSWHKEGGRAEPEHRRREEEEKEERGSESERERARARLLQVEKRLEEEQQRSRSLQDEAARYLNSVRSETIQ